KKPETSSAAAAVLTTSTHSSSRDENAPLPSQSRAGPGRSSLRRSAVSARAGAPATRKSSASADKLETMRMEHPGGGGTARGRHDAGATQSMRQAHRSRR